MRSKVIFYAESESDSVEQICVSKWEFGSLPTRQMQTVTERNILAQNRSRDLIQKAQIALKRL